MRRVWSISIGLWMLAALMSACDGPNPQPPGLTPIPTLAPGATPTLIAALPSIAELTPTAAPVATAAAGATVVAPSAPTATTASDAALGAAIFQMNCTACHGSSAQGGTEPRGEDAPPLRNNTLIQGGGNRPIQIIANGRSNLMPAWLQANGGPLTEQEIGHVLAYLQTLQNVPQLPIGAPLPTPTPFPANAAPVRPSEPGATGPAATLIGDVTRGRALFGKYCATCHGPQGVMGLPNPGSNSGVVPALNPIHPTIANVDAKIFANNLDVFIEHGSAPAGKNPSLRMPAFGDGKLLNTQQIADVIAYVISLNKR
jgi:mono/diheme cytochrome c family protein